MTIDAAGSVLRPEMIDRAIRSLVIKPIDGPLVRSHPVQIRMYESLGLRFGERNNQRVTVNGLRWQMDGRLPIDEIHIEGHETSVLIKNLAIA